MNMLKEELNVKEVSWETKGDYAVELDVTLSKELMQEGLAREVVRIVQQGRKEAGLDVDDRIELSLQGSKPVQSAITAHKDYISAETLAKSLTDKAIDGSFEKIAKIGKESLTVQLKKV